MIRFEKVSKSYGNVQVLKDLNFEIGKGELVAFIGPSGCGKTTTLRLINRLIEPTSGTIRINGQDTAKVNPVELRRGIGYVIQQIGLMPHMTIAGNIGLVPRLKGWKKKDYADRIDRLLEMVGLDPQTFKNRYPAELSGGQQQRIGVIRALAADPPIILMDEPFSALDPISREQLQDELVRLQKEIRKTIVVVTHDIDEALKIADRIAIMHAGRIVQFDTPENLLKHPANDFVREFIGEKRLLERKAAEGAGGAPISHRVADVMFTPEIRLPAHCQIAEAMERTARAAQDAFLIIGENDDVIGAMSVSALREQAGHRDGTLGDLLEQPAAKVDVTVPWHEASHHLLKHPCGAVLAVREGRVIGVVTARSILGAISPARPAAASR